MAFENVNAVSDKLLAFSSVASVKLQVEMDYPDKRAYLFIYCYKRPNLELRASVKKILKAHNFTKVKVKYKFPVF